MLNDYLQYELYHSIGAYGIASERLMCLEERMTRQHRAEPSDTAERNVLEHDKLLRVTRLSRQYNEQLVRERHYADRSPTGDSRYRVRHPIPEDLPLTLRERFDFEEHEAGVQDARENPWASPLAWAWVLNFYDAAIAAIALQLRPHKLAAHALKDYKAAERAVIFADSIVWPRERRRSGPISDRERWLRGKRFVDRRNSALQKLPGVPRHTPPRSNDAIEFIYRLTTDHLGSGYGSVPMFVISALAEAHLSMHAVEGWKSMALHDHAELAAGQLGHNDRWLWKELDRCIVLNTFVYCASRSAPWMFADDADQCRVIFEHFDDCWQHGVPARALWISAQTSLLALHRRAYSHGLKGERTAAYNDYHKLQRQILNARRRVEAAPVHVAGALDFLALLEARTHQNIGELYRAEHAQRPALKHLATAVERLDAMPADGEIGEVLTNSRWYVRLQMSRGKASYEMGRHKDCLRWHLGAWRAFLKLLAAETQMEQGTDAIDKAIVWLEEVRFEPELRKHEAQQALRPIMDQLDRVRVPGRLSALAAEILLRLGHVLFVLNLGANREPSGGAAARGAQNPPDPTGGAGTSPSEPPPPTPHAAPLGGI